MQKRIPSNFVWQVKIIDKDLSPFPFLGNYIEIHDVFHHPIPYTDAERMDYSASERQESKSKNSSSI